MRSIKIKVFLGYFTLTILASLTIWVIYTEILQYSRERVDFNPATNKFTYINNILTNLYQAEGLERNYIQTGQLIHYVDYLILMDTIGAQIDTLATLINDPIQQIHTDSIKKLLSIKQQNLEELSAIKKKSSSSAIFQKGLKKLPSMKDSINQLAKIYKNPVVSPDTIYVKENKKTFFSRISSIFSSKKKKVSDYPAIRSKSLKHNNLVVKANPTDSIAGYIAAIMTEIKNEGVALETRLNQKEQEILENDRTLTFQLRQMLTYLEKVELTNSFQKVADQQNHIAKTTREIILIGSLALVTIIFFLVNILNDITKSQRYRKDLELAKAYSESLLKSKEQFMLSLTHDLKSPLNSIIGFTGFMEEDEKVPVQHKKYLQNISSASKHILKLVNDLLDLARLETGKLTIDRIAFDLKRLIEDIAEGFGPQALAKNLDLQLHFNQSLSAVYMGDPSRITQIFSNLISNAINYTESGSVTIRVSMLDQAKNTDQIQVEVIDTGIGISEENSQFVFGEFNRVATSGKQHEGTGLGLTITKKIIDLLQGTITLESKPGRGSCFTVVLPLERGNPLTDIAPEIRKIKASPESISGLKIWLIDDDELLLEMATNILKSAGAEVHSFSDPYQAINSFNRGCADMVITDIQMPGISGIEVLKQIQEKNGGSIASIAISGKNPIQNEYDGFTTFIQKPYQAHTLIDVISEQKKEIIKSVKLANAGYNLDKLLAFVEGDQESLRQILVSFVNTGNKNLQLLRQYIEEENIGSIAELSHKMLPFFRQIEVNDVVELLVQLERNDFHTLSKEDYCSIGKSVAEKIEALLQKIGKEENLNVC
jgi:signal transduction histidine kinase/FixJ family two-component response regulator